MQVRCRRRRRGERCAVAREAPTTILEGMRPPRYHERRVDRDTPVAATASSRVTQPSSTGVAGQVAVKLVTVPSVAARLGLAWAHHANGLRGQTRVAYHAI